MPQSKKGRQKVTIFGKTQYFVGLSLLLVYGGGHLKKNMILLGYFYISLFLMYT